jgi:uncharacterized protein YecE (DUF72 family)
MKRGGELRVGISGWRYPGRRGKFYPKDLPHRRELEYASRILSSVEINGSFYSLQLPSSYLLALRKKLGPILWQLLPNLSWNKERLEEFFELLPRDTRSAAKLAKKHNDNLKARAWMKVDASYPLRYALEVRHKSFMTQEFFELLRKHNIAFAFADTARKFPYAEDLTSDFIYIRLHGATKLYVSGYNDKLLKWWANRIEHWRKGKQTRDAKTVGTSHRGVPTSRRFRLLR